MYYYLFGIHMFILYVAKTAVIYRTDSQILLYTYEPMYYFMVATFSNDQEPNTKQHFLAHEPFFLSVYQDTKT